MSQNNEDGEIPDLPPLTDEELESENESGTASEQQNKEE